MQNTNLIIVDNFYEDADDIRAFALKQPFDVTGNYPGRRTLPFHNWPGLKEGIQKIVQNAGGKILPGGGVGWDGPYTTSFQYTTKNDKSWIHPDYTTKWAGVCYLTPDAPVTGGTGIFRHKETGLERPPYLASGKQDEDWLQKHCWPISNDMDKWDMTTMVGNVYNRLVLYRGDLFHSSLDYFGEGLEDGRLFQTFFFDTEY